MASPEPHRLEDGRGGPGTVTSLRLPPRPVPAFKRCPMCGEVKPLAEFAKDTKRKSGVQSRCRLCAAEVKREYRRRNPLTDEQRERMKETHARFRKRHRKRLRAKDKLRKLNDVAYRTKREKNAQRSLEKRHARTALFAAIKSEMGCLFCGETEACALDLHHVDPSEKDFPVGNMFGSQRWERVREEAAKCVVLCANCHRKVHHGFLALPPVASLARVHLPVEDPGAGIHQDGRKYGERWASKRAADASASLREPSS